jgi:hypothetical protein
MRRDDPRVPDSLLPVAVAVPVLLAGPLVTLWLLSNSATVQLVPEMYTTVAWVALVVWSPFTFFSIPALITQDARDRHRSDAVGLARISRAFTLLLTMLVVPGQLRTISWAALAGVGVAAYGLIG